MIYKYTSDGREYEGYYMQVTEDEYYLCEFTVSSGEWSGCGLHIYGGWDMDGIPIKIDKFPKRAEKHLVRSLFDGWAIRN